MPKKKEAKKEKVPVKKERTIAPRKSTYAFPSLGTSDLWRSFDDVFNRFRSDFEDLLFPSPWIDVFPIVPVVRTPLVDLEDQGNNFLLKAEMPGFKKEDIEIDVQEYSISVRAEVGWIYDKKEQECMQGKSLQVILQNNSIT